MAFVTSVGKVLAAPTVAGSVLVTPNLGNMAYDDNPSSRAALGLFGSQPSDFIYFRENFF